MPRPRGAPERRPACGSRSTRSRTSPCRCCSARSAPRPDSRRCSSPMPDSLPPAATSACARSAAAPGAGEAGSGVKNTQWVAARIRPLERSYCVPGLYTALSTRAVHIVLHCTHRAGSPCPAVAQNRLKRPRPRPLTTVERASVGRHRDLVPTRRCRIQVRPAQADAPWCVGFVLKVRVVWQDSMSLSDHSQFEELKASGLLPSPKGVALAVMRLAQDESTTNADMARTIKADPAL